MASRQKIVDVKICDVCGKEADVSACAHCRKEVCADCGWLINCGSFGFLLSFCGVACGSCRDHLTRLLVAFGFAERIGR